MGKNQALMTKMAGGTWGEVAAKLKQDFAGKIYIFINIFPIPQPPSFPTPS